MSGSLHSDGFDGDPGREIVDGEGLDDDDQSDDRSPSPRSALLSLGSNGNLAGDLGVRQRTRRGDKRDRTRYRSSTHRELIKLLINEELEAKQTRRALTAALDRLDSETQRAQEAERRALQMAERFKVVNEARITAQQETNRVNEELRLYKLQLDTAQREVQRAQEYLRDIETQRDEAEASAARARTTARKLREQQLINLAREDGRRQGYDEGLRQGYQEARQAEYRGDRTDLAETGESVAPMLDDRAGDMVSGELDRTAPLDGLSSTLFNLPSQPRDGIHTAPSIAITLEEPAARAPPQGAYNGGAQGSRFRENIASPGASTVSISGSAPPSGPTPWPPPPREAPKYIRPALVHGPPPSPSHPDYTVPPDGYIPSAGPDGIVMPPPHEFSRQPLTSPPTPLSPLPDIPSVNSAQNEPSSGMQSDRPRVVARDYAYSQKQRASPGSLAESLPSTTISHFDLVNSPRTAARALAKDRDRRSGLSAIPEVTSSMEMSPATESRVRHSLMPDPLIFPVPSPGPEGRYAEDGTTSPQGRFDTGGWASHRQPSPSQPGVSVDYPSYGAAPSQRSRAPSPYGARPLSPTGSGGSHHRRSRSVNSGPNAGSFTNSGGGSRGHRRIHSSDAEVTISVEPPSNPESNVSPSAPESGRLTPNSTSQSLHQSRPAIPTEPNSPTLRNMPSMGTLSSIQGFPLGFMPTGPPLPSHDIPRSKTPMAQPSPKRNGKNLYSGLGTQPVGVPAPQSTASSFVDSGINNWAQSVRSASRNGSMDGDIRPTTPGYRPPSALGNISSSSHRPHTPNQARYVPAPTPPGVRYPEPSVVRQSTGTASPGRAAAGIPLPASAVGTMSPRSGTSRLSVHHRSLSLNAGSTPATVARPLSTGPASQLRRVPSTGSIASNASGKSGQYGHFNPDQYLDAAWLSSQDVSVQSPHTMANTRQNAAQSFGAAAGGRASPSLSYVSYGSRT
ncbi:hypothetical protein AcW1_004867 [Taiwanofungus camphoratus]|nr:hypothetical protein AcW1_004867 [Antrodia cinnamomea]